MESTLFQFVFRYSMHQQLRLLLLTLIAFPFLYLSLELPKTIINEAIGGSDFPHEIPFLEISLTQVEYLFLLSGFFLSLVFVNGGFKYVINVYGGIVGERMLRRLRYQLFERVLRFPLSNFRKVGQGEIVSMVITETDPLGGFMGDAVKLPAFQGGTLFVIVIFMFIQDPILGVAAISLYPIQAWFIPKLQKRLNAYKKELVVSRRRLSEHIGEVVSGVQEVHAHDTSEFELAVFGNKLANIFVIRLDIFKRKFMIKFLNNFIAQITPFFFYSIGGYLVIMGDLTFGALVAVLAAYKDLNAPWKELLNYYQLKEDTRIRYDLLFETFQPSGMLPSELQRGEPMLTTSGELPRLTGNYMASNVDLRDEPNASSSATVSFQLPLNQTHAFVGKGGSGTGRIGTLIARIDQPISGLLSIGDKELALLHEGVTGRRIGYIGPEPRLRSGSLFENMVYPLKHRCEEGGCLDLQAEREAELTGNSTADSAADWIDYSSAQARDAKELIERLMRALAIADLDKDVYQLGLQGILDPQKHGDLIERIMQARVELRERLDDSKFADLIEPFDSNRYNTNMSVAENLLFGAPADLDFSFETMADHPLVRKILDEMQLTTDLIKAGQQLAELMVELFADVPPGSELFEQFSFISAEDLPEFRALLGRIDPEKLEALEAEDESRLLSLPLKVIPARHRLGLIDEAMQTRLLQARKLLVERSAEAGLLVNFFNADKYNPQGSVQDNILFGRLAYGRARSASQVGGLVREVIEKLGLVERIMEVGLDSQVGLNGTRLTGIQRQKLSIARTLLKHPDVFILDQATAPLDTTSEIKIIENLLKNRADAGLIYVLQDATLAERVDNTLVLEDGRVVQQGKASELNSPGSAYSELLTPR